MNDSIEQTPSLPISFANYVDTCPSIITHRSGRTDAVGPLIDT